MKERLEEIEHEILRIGRMIDLEKEERTLLTDYYNTLT